MYLLGIEMRLLDILSQRAKGQGLVEYSLILLSVALLVIFLLLVEGKQVQNLFSNIVAGLST